MKGIAKEYFPPRATSWHGPRDPNAERNFSSISLLDLNSGNLSIKPGAAVLIGFSCDEGIRRNLGRPGAHLGPAAFRDAFRLLPFAGTKGLYDAGDVHCLNGHLEEAQIALSHIIARLMEKKAVPVVIGGGHELAFGQFQGIAKAHSGPISIINFDAHFDLRPLLDDHLGTSGTPFTQISLFCEERQIPFDYTVIGIQRSGNTKSLFQKAENLNVQTITAEEIVKRTIHVENVLNQIASKHTPIYLSICLDVFSASSAPGVSAPQPLGLDPWQLLPFIQQIASSGNIAAIGLAELSPPYDIDNRTAKLAAAILSEILYSF